MNFSKKNHEHKKANKSFVSKTFKITLLLLSMLLFCPTISQAQDKSQKKSYRVHEDQVKLSMVSEYEKTVKELISLLKKHKVQDVSWITLNSNDSRYSFISSINGMSDLDKPSFVKTLVEKEGKEAVYDIFDRMDKCYDTELDYIITLDEELTYMPQGFTQTPEGENYRNNHMLYVAPANRAAVKEKLKAVKELFKNKESKVYYRVYKSGFGANGEYYMVAVAAKDAMDDASKGKANNELFGDEGKKVFGELFSSLLKYEDIKGWIRPDLGYSSN